LTPKMSSDRQHGTNVVPWSYRDREPKSASPPFPCHVGAASGERGRWILNELLLPSSLGSLVGCLGLSSRPGRRSASTAWRSQMTGRRSRPDSRVERHQLHGAVQLHHGRAHLLQGGGLAPGTTPGRGQKWQAARWRKPRLPQRFKARSRAGSTCPPWFGWRSACGRSRPTDRRSP